MPLKISIIEDNQVISRNIRKYLTFQDDMEIDISVGSVESYFHELGLRPLRHSDVLLLDIGLPGISGLDAIPKILQRSRDLDIIMLTTYEEEAIILKALCSGAASYLSKRSTLQEIADAIRIVADGGAYMSPTIAKEIVNHLAGGRKSKATTLTPRQREILELLSQGESYASIGTLLFLSIETIRTHIKKMYKTLHVNNKTEAIAMYLRGEIK